MRAAVTVLTSYYLYRPPPRSSTFGPRAAKNCIAQLWERERERERVSKQRKNSSIYVWRVGVPRRRGPAGGEPDAGRGVGEAQGAAAHADGGGGLLPRLAGAQAGRARLGALLLLRLRRRRRRDEHAAVPQALLRRPHLPADGLCAIQLRPHVRHRRQEP
jgi:hypothetical protein